MFSFDDEKTGFTASPLRSETLSAVFLVSAILYAHFPARCYATHLLFGVKLIGQFSEGITDSARDQHTDAFAC